MSNKMSRDRVKLTVPAHRCENFKYRQLLHDAFGIDRLSKLTFKYSRAHGTNVITIICRPSQFARFVILRNQSGLDNMVKELHPELVPEGYSEQPTFEEAVASAANTTVNVVERVFSAAKIGALADSLRHPFGTPPANEYQVWQNPNQVEV